MKKVLNFYKGLRDKHLGQGRSMYSRVTTGYNMSGKGGKPGPSGDLNSSPSWDLTSRASDGWHRFGEPGAHLTGFPVCWIQRHLTVQDHLTWEARRKSLGNCLRIFLRKTSTSGGNARNLEPRPVFSCKAEAPGVRIYPRSSKEGSHPGCARGRYLVLGRARIPGIDEVEYLTGERQW